MQQSQARILVVDDDAASRAVYRDWILEVGDVEVLEAHGGQEALEIAARHELAMVVLDVNMPDMDGFETAAMLRQEPRNEHAPILFISQEFHSSQRVRGYRMGAVDCLVTEPMNPEILAQKARVFLQLYRKRRELQDLLEVTRRQNHELNEKLSAFVQEQQELRHELTHDLLSGIPNRSLFNDRLEAAINRAGRTRQHFALVYVDLDGFKRINDRHGHATGDELIKAIAHRLQRGIRATDTVARLGGDEFGMLFEGLDSAAAAEYLAAKIRHLLLQPVHLTSEQEQRSIELQVGASIGIAMYPDHAKNSDELARLADMAMYAVKRAGGGTRIYDPGVADDAPAFGIGLSRV